MSIPKKGTLAYHRWTEAHSKFLFAGRHWIFQRDGIHIDFLHKKHLDFEYLCALHKRLKSYSAKLVSIKNSKIAAFTNGAQIYMLLSIRKGQISGVDLYEEGWRRGVSVREAIQESDVSPEALKLARWMDWASRRNDKIRSICYSIERMLEQMVKHHFENVKIHENIKVSNVSYVKTIEVPTKAYGPLIFYVDYEDIGITRVDIQMRALDKQIISADLLKGEMS